MLDNVIIISGIIVIVLNVLILMYVSDLEKNKCGCSKHWMRDFIKYWSMLLILVAVLTLVVPSALLASSNNVLCKALYGLYGLVGFVYLVIIIVYYFDIKKKTNCECALDWKRHVLIYPIVVFALAFLVGFVSGVSKSMSKGKMGSSRRNSRGSSRKN